MATLTEDDVLEQLDAQDNLFSFMKTAHSILLQGIRQFLPSLFVDNDEEIVEYAVKPLLAQSGPLDDIDVALRLIYALGKNSGLLSYSFTTTEKLFCLCMLWEALTFLWSPATNGDGIYSMVKIMLLF